MQASILKVNRIFRGREGRGTVGRVEICILDVVVDKFQRFPALEFHVLLLCITPCTFRRPLWKFGEYEYQRFHFLAQCSDERNTELMLVRCPERAGMALSSAAVPPSRWRRKTPHPPGDVLNRTVHVRCGNLCLAKPCIMLHLCI